MLYMWHSTTIPGFEVKLCTVRDYLHYLNIVKSRHLSNILTRGFLSKCKTDLILHWTNQNCRKKKQ